jgi:hypothetical protein
VRASNMAELVGGETPVNIISEGGAKIFLT